MATFGTLKKEKKSIGGGRPDGPDRSDYMVFELNDLVNGNKFQGEPYLGDTYDFEYEKQAKNGELKTVKGYSANLYISNDNAQETIRARVKRKNDKDMFTAWQGSVLYDLIDSIEELNEPGSAGQFNVYTMSYHELQEYINSFKEVMIQIIEHESKYGPYNTARFVQMTR